MNISPSLDLKPLQIGEVQQMDLVVLDIQLAD